MRINEEVKKFGNENGYTFIIGVTGHGSLMYANESEDVTEEVIDFLNKNYDKGK